MQKDNAMQIIENYRGYHFMHREAEFDRLKKLHLASQSLSNSHKIVLDIKSVDWAVQHRGNNVTPKFMLMVRGAANAAADATTTGSSLVMNLCRIDGAPLGMDASKREFKLGEPLDELWYGGGGWLEPVVVVLKGKAGQKLPYTIPANPEYDCIEFEVQDEIIASKALGDYTQHAIPRIIFSSTKSLAFLECLHKSTSSFDWLNPSWTYIMTEDERGGHVYKLRKILELEGERAALAYINLAPGAYRADLWRYIALFHFGGVYADDKLTLLRPLDAILPPNARAVLIKDFDDENIAQGFIAIVPRHRLMRLAIDKVIANVEARFYGDNSLEPTGPKLFARCFRECGPECIEGTIFWKFVHRQFGIVDHESSKIPWQHRILVHNIEYRRMTYGWDQHNGYPAMWKNKRVYHEDKTPEQLASLTDLMLGEARGQSIGLSIKEISWLATMVFYLLLALGVFICISKRQPPKRKQSSSK